MWLITQLNALISDNCLAHGRRLTQAPKLPRQTSGQSETSRRPVAPQRPPKE